MAEKEERIMIVADKPYYCNSCKKINNCSKDCKGYMEWFNRPDPIRHFYSRSEAINRMAKAICNMGDEETWGRVDDNYKHYCTAQAEWALNSLLGESND